MGFAERVKTWREEARISQAEFAQRVGVKQQTVAAWETGRAAPRPERARAIANALGIEEGVVARALTGVQPGEGMEERTRRLVDKIERLPERDRVIVESLIDQFAERSDGASS